jgi:hypothetical protein
MLHLPHNDTALTFFGTNRYVGLFDEQVSEDPHTYGLKRRLASLEVSVKFRKCVLNSVQGFPSPDFIGPEDLPCQDPQGPCFPGQRCCLLSSTTESGEEDYISKYFCIISRVNISEILGVWRDRVLFLSSIAPATVPESLFPILLFDNIILSCSAAVDSKHNHEKEQASKYSVLQALYLQGHIVVSREHCSNRNFFKGETSTTFHFCSWPSNVSLPGTYLFF